MKLKFVLVFFLTLIIFAFTSTVQAGIVSNTSDNYQYSDYQHYYYTQQQAYPQHYYPTHPISYPTPTPYPQPQITGIPIVITNFQFNPQDIIIMEGSSVSWINYDYAPHTTTSENRRYNNENSWNSEDWDSGKLEYGQVYTKTFTKSGTYYYYCSFHPNMRGVIHVVSNTPVYYPQQQSYQVQPTYYYPDPWYGYSGGHPDVWNSQYVDPYYGGGTTYTNTAVIYGY